VTSNPDQDERLRRASDRLRQLEQLDPTLSPSIGLIVQRFHDQCEREMPRKH
jgi:hypothetical protein